MIKRPIDIFSYVQTIFFSIIVGCMFTGAIIYYAQNDVINNASSAYNEKVLNEYIKNTVIQQNEDLEHEHPNDYRIDIHLGYLHKVIKEYDKAEEYYKKAVQKAPVNVYKPLYELASFYIQLKRYDEATDIMESLPHKSNKSLIRYQSYLYRKLGDAYYEDAKYYYAIESYETSLYYWHKLPAPGSAYIKEVNNHIFQSSINLADMCVNNNKVPEAIDFLNKAEEIKPDNFNVQYKLALTTSATDPERAYKYFNKLFKQYPQKVDYVAYYKLLDNLADFYEENGEYTKAKLYAFRAKNLLNTVSQELIYPKDVDFRITESVLYNYLGKSKIISKFTLQNISSFPIKFLKMEIVYKLNKEVVETYTKTIIDDSNKLMIGDSYSSTIIPKVFKKYRSKDISNIIAEVYLYKADDKKICVFNDKLFKNRVEKVEQPKQGLDCHTYIKFFAEQIVNFEESIKSYRDSR